MPLTRTSSAVRMPFSPSRIGAFLVAHMRPPQCWCRKSSCATCFLAGSNHGMVCVACRGTPCVVHRHGPSPRALCWYGGCRQQWPVVRRPSHVGYPWGRRRVCLRYSQRGLCPLAVLGESPPPGEVPPRRRVQTSAQGSRSPSSHAVVIGRRTMLVYSVPSVAHAPLCSAYACAVSSQPDLASARSGNFRKLPV